MRKHIHLIGIGGIGVSAVARLLLERGWRISGCDQKENDLIKHLRSAGVDISIGHDTKHLEGVSTVVYSSAITEDNLEIQEAKRRGIKLLKRAEVLAYLMRDKTVITVTGMHGKTTTTSLASHVLIEAGVEPTAAVGGILQNMGNNALVGRGKFFIADADESDGSLLYYHPQYSIITNIDQEHMDYYKDFNSILETFRRFIGNTKENGCLFCWRDDPYLSDLLKDCQRKVVYFGLTDKADVYATDIELKGLSSEFNCFRRDEFIGRFNANLGGRHNILNTLAVIALGLELGISVDLMKAALVNYEGTRRRLQVKFKSADYLVLDDYGHHPTEIKATLETVKSLNPGRLLVVFQPHRYSRTKFFLDSFASCFDSADCAIITDIYSAGELPVRGVDDRSIYDRLKSRDRIEAQFLEKDNVLDHVLKILKPQDVVVTLGAGDITKISDELAEALKRQD